MAETIKDFQFYHRPDGHVELNGFKCSLEELRSAVPEYDLPDPYVARRVDGFVHLVWKENGSHESFPERPWLVGNVLRRHSGTIIQEIQNRRTGTGTG
jgi:hypothetical protein